MDDKTLGRIKKLQALAERGVGGEKDTARAKLQKMLDDNGISSLDDLLEDKYEYFLFSYHGRHELRLLSQCIYKVMGHDSDRTKYRTRGTRNKVGIYCTKAQKIEIDLEFEFYRNVFYDELDIFVSAFIQKQEIFPDDCPESDDVHEITERDLRMAAMTEGIQKKTRNIMIESN